MSPGELWTEYKEVEEMFLEYYDTDGLVVGLKENDPLELQKKRSLAKKGQTEPVVG